MPMAFPNGYVYSREVRTLQMNFLYIAHAE